MNPPASRPFAAACREGEKVVASGLFLIDSEANIAGALERMRAQAPDAAAPAAHAH